MKQEPTDLISLMTVHTHTHTMTITICTISHIGVIEDLHCFSHRDCRQPAKFRDNSDYGHFVRLDGAVKSHQHWRYLDNSVISIHLQHVLRFLVFCQIFCHSTVAFAVLYRAILRIGCSLSRQLHAMPYFHAEIGKMEKRVQ